MNSSCPHRHLEHRERSLATLGKESCRKRHQRRCKSHPATWSSCAPKRDLAKALSSNPAAAFDQGETQYLCFSLLKDNHSTFYAKDSKQLLQQKNFSNLSLFVPTLFCIFAH
jgi:hypothetical protein